MLKLKTKPNSFPVPLIDTPAPAEGMRTNTSYDERIKEPGVVKEEGTNHTQDSKPKCNVLLSMHIAAKARGA